MLEADAGPNALDSLAATLDPAKRATHRSRTRRSSVTTFHAGRQATKVRWLYRVVVSSTVVAAVWAVITVVTTSLSAGTSQQSSGVAMGVAILFATLSGAMALYTRCYVVSLEFGRGRLQRDR